MRRPVGVVVFVGSSSLDCRHSGLSRPLPDRPCIWPRQRDPGGRRGRLPRENYKAHQGKKWIGKRKKRRERDSTKAIRTKTAFFFLFQVLSPLISTPSTLENQKPIQVYHVPKKPELDLLGRTGVVSEVVRFQDGAELSATMPYRVVLDDDDEAKAALEAGGKKPMKVTVHLSGGEIELLA